MTACERYAEARKVLRGHRKAAMAELGLNEDSYKELEKEALREMGEEAEGVETIHGKLIVSECPIYMHKNSELVGYSRKITFKED